MEDIILYSTGCPRCKVLKAKLEAKNIPYTENSSLEEMDALGITSVPMMKVGDEMLSFGDAARWINAQRETE